MKAADCVRLLQRVAEVYARCLRESPAAAECLQALNVTDRLVLEQFQAGYSDGSLPQLLPQAGELLEKLRGDGLVDAAGNETLRGCLVVPAVNAAGSIEGFVGIAPGTELKPQEVLVPLAAQGLARGSLTGDGSSLMVPTSKPHWTTSPSPTNWRTQRLAVRLPTSPSPAGAC